MPPSAALGFAWTLARRWLETMFGWGVDCSRSHGRAGKLLRSAAAKVVTPRREKQGALPDMLPRRGRAGPSASGRCGCGVCEPHEQAPGCGAGLLQRDLLQRREAAVNCVTQTCLYRCQEVGQACCRAARPRSNFCFAPFTPPRRRRFRMRGQSRAAKSSTHSARAPSRPALPTSW